MAQRIRRETTNLKIAGSNPVGDSMYVIKNFELCAMRASECQYAQPTITGSMV